MNENNSVGAVESFDNIADSTDWLSTPLSGLATVEAALRCQVCKDLYRTPMLTSCNHTFCSLCIRRALSNDGRCPLCRATDQELKLRSNWSMEEVVTAFTQARPAVLDFARQPVPTRTPPQAMTTAVSDITPASTRSPKRKLRSDNDGMRSGTVADSSLSDSQHSNKRLRSSTRLNKSRSVETTTEIDWQEAHIQVPEPASPQIDPFEPDDGLVACPICWQRMRPLQVDKHLDTSCPGEPRPQQPPLQAALKTRTSRSATPATPVPTASSSSRRPPPAPPAPQLERLPAINYSMLKEAQLRKKLGELGIPIAGSRQLLEKRHKEWMTIWNANCDSMRPRRKHELLQDLDVWERTLGARAPTSSRSLNLGAQIKDKNFDGAAWAAKHDDSFQDLIASARRSRMAAAQKQEQEPEEEQQKPREKQAPDKPTGDREGIREGERVDGGTTGPKEGKPALDVNEMSTKDEGGAIRNRSSPSRTPINGDVHAITESDIYISSGEPVTDLEGVERAWGWTRCS